MFSISTSILLLLTLAAADPKVEVIKACVTTSPEYISTRTGSRFVIQCNVQLCTENDDPITDTEFCFRNPIFDWNSNFAHLKLTNGSCDSSKMFCSNQLILTREEVVKILQSKSVDQMEIRCGVADYARSPSSEYDYVIGDSSVSIKYFKGKRIHEACNQTEECGENMVCSNNVMASDARQSIPGYCECPAEGISVQNGNAHLKTFILVDDQHFEEKVCVETRRLNETCGYDQQCKSSDLNTYCKPIYDRNGLATKQLMCECEIGFVQQHGKCIKPPVTETLSSNLTYRSESLDARADGASNITAAATTTSTNSNGVIHMLWVIPVNAVPNNDPLATSVVKRKAFLKKLSWMILFFVIAIPVTALAVFLYRNSSGEVRRQPETAFDNPNYVTNPISGETVFLDLDSKDLLKNEKVLHEMKK